MFRYRDALPGSILSLGMLLAALLPGSTGPAAAQGIHDVVAVTGDIAPGGNGRLKLQFPLGTPVLNNVGEVAFVTDLSETSGGTLDDRAIYRGTGGPLTQISRDFVNTSGSSAILDTSVTLNDAGQVAYRTQVSSLLVPPHPEIHRGDGGTPILIARVGGVVLGGGSFQSLERPVLNDAGSVAFRATFASQSGVAAGIYRFTGGTITRIAREGDEAPGPNPNGTLSSFGTPFLNSTGQVAFIAELSNTDGGTSDNRAVYRGSGGALTQLARIGQPAPGGMGILSRAFPRALNASGQSALLAVVTGTSGTNNDFTAVYLGSGGALSQIARQGQAAPDGNGVFYTFPATDLNDSGQAAFYATLKGTSGGAVDDQGVFRVSDATITQIAREGQPGPDGNGTISVYGDSVLLNASGEVAFLGGLTGTSGGLGLFLANGIDVIQVVRVGQWLAGDTIRNVSLGDLNDAGQVAYNAELSSFSRVIGRFTIPEIHWTAGGSGAWTTDANWTQGIEPNSFHHTLIDPTEHLTVLAPTSNKTVKSLTIGNRTGVASSGVATLKLTGTTAGDLRSLENVLITQQGELLLENGRVFAAPAVINSGVIRGTGSIHGEVTTHGNGLIRTGPGQTLTLHGMTHTNEGLVEAIGSPEARAEIHFFGILTNANTGQIAGRNALLRFNQPGLGSGMTNRGTVAISSGTTDLFGNITNVANSGRIIVSGNSTATFYDNVTNGGRFNVSTGSTAVIFGTLSQNGIVGGGTVFLEGNVQPGTSPGLMQFGGDVHIGALASLEIELGGTTAGTQFDQVNVARNATLDGALQIQLIDGFVPTAGDRFSVLTFAAADGRFTSVGGLNAAPGIALLPAYFPDRVEIVATAAGETTWGVDAGGAASVGSNWLGGVPPGGVGDKATFGNIISDNRTVVIDEPLTLGALKFDDDNAYRLDGPETLTLREAENVSATIDVEQIHGNGAHMIAAPVVVASDLDIVQNSLGALTIAGALDNSAGRALTKSGPGMLIITGAQNHGPGAALVVAEGLLTMNTDAGSAAARNLAITANSSATFGSTQHLAALSIGPGATAQVTSGGPKNVVTGSLTIAGAMTPTATLDITANAAAVDYPATGPNPETTIRQQIISGRGGSGFGATWTGKGVTSSTAASQVATDPESVSVAYAVNGELPLGPYTNFRGEPVDESSVLIRYTRTADANLDGLVNDDDVTIVGATYSPGVPNPNWALGDFDYNGFVDDDDVTLLGVFYDPEATPLAAPALDGATTVSSIPEPSTLMSLTIAICLAAMRPLRLRNRFRSLLAPSAAGLLVGLCLLSSATVAQEPIAPYSGRVWVFIGTYTNGKSEGIYRAQLDLKSGALTQPELAAKVENPSFLALHPSGRFLYAAGELSNFEGKPGGAVSALALDGETGKLALLNQQSSRGAGPCHLVVDRAGKNVLVANYGGGSVAALPIDENGRLQPASSFIQHEGKSVNPRRQEAPHAHSINLDPAGKFAVVADLGLDKVLIYRFDPEQGRLTANDPPHASVSAGAGPRHFAFHPSGRFAYVINEMHSTVTAFDYDAKQGTLVQSQTVSTLPEPHQGNSTAEVQVHPGGKFLYGSNRGHNSLATFAIDPGTGRLEPVGHQETGGKTPRNFGIDPTGSFVLAANQSSDSVVVFRVDQKTGRLTPTGHSIEVPTPVCVKFAPIER